jgi:hypothetical protein
MTREIYKFEKGDIEKNIHQSLLKTRCICTQLQCLILNQIHELVTGFDNLELGVYGIIVLGQNIKKISFQSQNLTNQYQLIDARFITKNKANINNSCYYYNITTIWKILFFYANACIGESLKSQ